ncbi:MAG: response regulator [Nitrospirota bacterium]
MNDSCAPIRLLVFEDHPEDAKLIQELLAQSRAAFAITIFGRLDDGLNAFTSKPFDIILLDLNLQDSKGVETLNKVVADIPDVPIIVIAGIHDETIAIQSISEGAQDYLVKGQFDSSLLVRTIQYARERKKVENALQESENRYKSLFASNLDCLYKIDKNSHFIMMNHAGAELFGYRTPEEMIGTSAEEIWVDSKERHKFIQVLQHNKMIKSYPFKAKKRNGEIIYLEASSYVLEDVQGAYIGHEGIMRDVTEKRKLEEQLVQSQKIEAIGTLAGGVAHDFNNILTAIIGYTYVVLMKLNKDDPLNYELQQVLAAADRAAMLTQSLLAFSRKQTVHLAPIDISDIISKFGTFVSRLIREDVELHTICAKEELTVMVDRAQIEQALMNLITNAQDAMPRGGRLTIEAKRMQLDGSFILAYGYGKVGEYALISVSDTGIGMDEQTRGKIFEPFFTTKPPGKGTGLGLAMVYGTVKKHEGFINVYSEPRNGTTFKIYLPLTDVPRKKNELQELRKTNKPHGGKETILVAEDDEALRKLMLTVLTDFGYQVIPAMDGIEAIKQFADHKDTIRLALLDVVMPRKNGKQVYKEIISALPDLKVIFMSGYAEGILDDQHIQAGQVAFLIKPISPTDLLQKVREVLDGKPPAV